MSTLERNAAAAGGFSAGALPASASAPLQQLARVVHLSTAHGRRDIRIHLKECDSLAAAGYEVHCIMADGRGEERIGRVQVHDIGAAAGRFQRMLLRPWRILAAARAMRARLYHFHDPELLLIALFLRRGGAQVIYDSHEDTPRSLLSRDWVPRWLRPGLSAVFERFENFVVRRLAAVVAATPHIAARFVRLNPRSLDISNYPLDAEMQGEVQPIGEARTVCYLGGIGRVRGIFEMVNALEHVDARLILAGPWESAETEQAARSLPGWSKVDYRGVVGRQHVRQIMAESRAGLVFFHPEPNHVDAQPNKMFEYMSAGLPILASDFPLWRTLMVESGAGRCADPLDPLAIAKAIGELLADPAEGRRMGQRGRDAVHQRFRWSLEERKLVNLYAELLQ